MKTYISTKTVQAEPMNEMQAAVLGYARPNNDNHEWREGYHVLYPDGYHSWCPKHVFEQSNKPAETVIDRLKIEFSDLHDRLRKLEDFRLKPDFWELSEQARELLNAQYGIMSAYHTILMTRIESLEPESHSPFIGEPDPATPCCKGLNGTCD